MGLDQQNVLLTLAWLWMADADQLRRLHYPSLATQAVKDSLTELRDQGLIEAQTWEAMQGRALAMWQLTAKGHRTVSTHPAYPGKTPSRSTTTFTHHKRTLDIVVRVIELAREKGLAGIGVWREVKINPKEDRATIDALLIFEVGGERHPNLVPWSLAKPLDDEALWRIAIEADDHTQSLQILVQKAEAYHQLSTTADWHQQWTQRFGQLPIVYVGTNDTERAVLIARTWETAWPEGHWAVTHDKGLAANEWLYRRAGTTTTSGLVYRTPVELDDQKKAEIQTSYEPSKSQPPRPLGELQHLLPWREGQTVTFSETGQVSYWLLGSWLTMPLRLSPAEQQLWRAYEAEKNEQAARRRQEYLKAQLDLETQEEARRQAAVATTRQHRRDMWFVMSLIVMLIVGIFAYVGWQGVMFFNTLVGLAALVALCFS